MIKIAVVMGTMHSGGKKNLVMEYYRHLDRSKIQFDFICNSDSNAIPEEEINELGGRVYVIPGYKNIIGNMCELYKILKKNQYPIIHGYNNTLNVFSMFVGKIAGVPIRINESISMAHKGDKKTIIKNFLKPFSRCFSTHYMANGEECGKWQFGDKIYNQKKVKIFKTVIDTEKNKFNYELRKQTRKELDIQDCIVIGHIGRLTAQKNTLFVIDIFNEIYKMNRKAKLLIIGDGELKDAMMKKIEKLDLEEAVLYLGRREDIQQFYNAMDCFLLPSLYEGLPVVGVEAECCGLPIFFSTEIPRESSPCNDLGVFVDLHRNAQEWAKLVLDKTKENIDKREDHSDTIKKCGFDSTIEASKLMKYYLKILQENS